MNEQLSQDQRIGSLTTPLGRGVLVLERFEGSEGLGELFEYRVNALSERENLDFDRAIGRSCSLTFDTYGSKRYFNGILVEAQWLGLKNVYYSYRLVLRPWFWLLTRTTDCRIFENQTAPDIIKKVFADRGFNDFRSSLTENYPKLEYCVQYRETDFAFLSRLMELHGIYYFFEHTEDKHMLVLADSKSSHQPVPGRSSVPFIRLEAQARRDREHLNFWLNERRFRTGKVELNDYNYEQPNADLKSDAKGSERYNKSDMEFYDYPGKYKERGDGEKYAKVALEAEQALDHRRHAQGDSMSLFPGGLVDLERHPCADENQQYVIVRSQHEYVDEFYRSGSDVQPAEIYRGNYEFQPSNRPYRMPIVTPKPRIHGIQTAKVVGQSGEEIDVDELGRIKVEFYWDRKKTPSCRTRVGQIWSGKKWGGQVIPRIGMEVIVDFLEGDPDRPLVTGTVYNDDYKLPYDLPGNKTVSGVKSDSSKGGGGYNEFKFEDKKLEEEISLHAQKNYKLVVLDTETRQIGENFTGESGPASRQTTLTMGDDQLTVASGNQSTTIAMSQTNEIGMSQTNEIGMSQADTIGLDQSVTIGTVQTVTVGTAVMIEAGAMILLQVGGSQIMITPSAIVLNSPAIALSAAAPIVASPAIA